ncbi:MAG TPA: ABC transporter ATP-binding protein [Planctomycetaceae bacterium]|nr:ABC transporter ATP-binding protein [Planctomycetaceae bacterium]
MSKPLLELTGVGRTFRLGEVSIDAVRDVDLTIARGEFVSIVGPSGSGKTTLLNLLGGIDRPTTGAVSFQGRDLASADRAALTRYRREHVGFVFQFFNLVPNLTAWENVQIAADICERPESTDAMLERVGLADRADHFPAQLSGGEQQRVAIARALVKRPVLLLCDEPTGALDLATGRRILSLLVDLNQNQQVTVVLVTHNVAISAVAHRVIHMSSGVIRDVVVQQRRLPPEEVEW